MELGFGAQVLAPNEIRGSRRVERQPEGPESPVERIGRKGAESVAASTGVALELSPEAEALIASGGASSAYESKEVTGEGPSPPGEFSDEEEEEVRRLSARGLRGVANRDARTVGKARSEARRTRIR